MCTLVSSSTGAILGFEKKCCSSVFVVLNNKGLKIGEKAKTYIFNNYRLRSRDFYEVTVHEGEACESTITS